MKKLLSLCLASFGLLFGAGLVADEAWSGDSSEGGCCAQAEPCKPADRPCGEAWIKMCKYNPCYYTTCRTVCDEKCCPKQCCRYVDQCYDVTCCRYVPQYYTKQCTRKVPQYYTVNETQKCYRKVYDKHVKWVPQYYYKHICGEAEPEAQACCQ